MNSSNQNTQTLNGRYKLDRVLGRGGFGTVYLANDEVFNRRVAVKILQLPKDNNRNQSKELRERFKREAVTAGRINHPNIVTIYDVVIPDNERETAYIVMEFLEGRDLHRHIQKFGPLSVEGTLKHFVNCLYGIGKGHEAGIVHKDLKPGNIFVKDPFQPTEAYCIVDFGVARVLHEAKFTNTGMIVGTPHYMAPEYIIENEVSPALDVYQMGLILAEALTGSPAVPHKEGYVSCCNRHFTGNLEIPVALLEGDFGAVLKRALATKPSHRFQNATEFGDALASVPPRSLPDEFMDTDSISTSKLFDGVNPFDQTADALFIPTIDAPLKDLWKPEREPVDDSFEGPITGGHAPGTGPISVKQHFQGSKNSEYSIGTAGFGSAGPESAYTMGGGSGPSTMSTSKSQRTAIVGILVLILFALFGISLLIFYDSLFPAATPDEPSVETVEPPVPSKTIPVVDEIEKEEPKAAEKAATPKVTEEKKAKKRRKKRKREDAVLEPPSN